jgi:hypothetical protein
MYKKHLNSQRRFYRVREFLTTNPIEGTQVKLQLLDQVVRELSVCGAEQDHSKRLTRGEVARQRAERNALWSNHMVPIARIARRAFAGNIPGMDQKFTLPPKRADNEALLNAARGMAQAAEEHAAVFMEEGVPPDFVVTFRAAIEALAAGLTVRVEGQRRRTTSREAIDKLVKRGNAAVDVLDAIVRPRLADRPELLVAWKSVKRPIEPGGSPGIGVELDITPVVKVA